LIRTNEPEGDRAGTERSVVLTSSPVDYGLTEAETIAHEVHAPRPDGFDAFWGLLREEVSVLSTAWQGRVDDGVTDVVIPSIRSVRVTARVTVPEAPVQGVVVTTHGSSAPDHLEDAPARWIESGLATVALRVRGYPPSTHDTDDLRDGWILRDIEDAESWIVRGAAADVMQAVRCARRHFGDGVPLALHGHSLGGGLAVIAAAQLEPLGLDVARLVIALPTFGAWRWRRDRYCNGSGALVNELLISLREDASRLLGTLDLFDAVHHARAITRPTLCKLAQRDDVVPAPSAAAVYNAIASPRKWRFVTQFGHYDGGVSDARRHVLFERCEREFLHPARDPEAVGAAIPEMDSPT
jgi:cephalosporin-C deacetylase